MTVVRQTPEELHGSSLSNLFLVGFFSREAGKVNCLSWSIGRGKCLTTRTDVDVGRIATWLILPVVIRSSQRLSHACVSKNPLL